MDSNAIHMMRHLAEASQSGKVPEHKEQLIQQIKKVKQLVQQPGAVAGRNEEVHVELSKLESQLNRVIQLEQQLMRKENVDVAALQNQLRDIRLRSSMESSGEMQRRLDKISFLMGEMAARFDSYTSVKDDRARRMEELEQKIKSRVEDTFKEFTAFEKSIAALEQKYSELKQGQNVDKEALIRIERRIRELRQKLIDKKVDMIEKRKSEAIVRRDGPHLDTPIIPREELPAPKQAKLEMFTSKPIPPPKLVFPEEERPQHTLMFPSSLPSQGEEFKFPVNAAKEEKLTELPILDSVEVSSDIPPPPGFEEEMRKIDFDTEEIRASDFRVLKNTPHTSSKGVFDMELPPLPEPPGAKKTNALSGMLKKVFGMK